MHVTFFASKITGLFTLTLFDEYKVPPQDPFCIHYEKQKM